jgi:hypothetical protein
MVRTTGNQKTSIMLFLSISISILAAVLVTGTGVNIVSAGNSISVQSKTNQHPVTHIVSSAAHGNSIQSKTNQHPVTSTGNPHVRNDVAVCRSWVDSRIVMDCDTAFFHMSITKGKDNTFTFTGELDGNVPPAYRFSPISGSDPYYGILDAPITIEAQYRDQYMRSQPGPGNPCNPDLANFCIHPFKFSKPPSNIIANPRFSGTFTACDDHNKPSPYGHEAYLYAKFPGGDYRTGTDTVLPPIVHYGAGWYGPTPHSWVTFFTDPCTTSATNRGSGQHTPMS